MHGEATPGDLPRDQRDILLEHPARSAEAGVRSPPRRGGGDTTILAVRSVHDTDPTALVIAEPDASAGGELVDRIELAPWARSDRQGAGGFWV